MEILPTAVDLLNSTDRYGMLLAGRNSKNNITQMDWQIWDSTRINYTPEH